MSVEQRLLELADETLRDARWKTEIRKIAEEVRIIEDRIQRLEEAGDKMASAWDKEWLTEADIEAIIDDWHGAKEDKP